MQLGEPGPDRSRRQQSQRRTDDRPRQQRLARPECHRADLHEQLVEQAVIVELTGQLAAADDPDILAAGCRDHLLVHWPDVTANETNVRAWNRRQLRELNTHVGCVYGQGCRPRRLQDRRRAAASTRTSPSPSRERRRRG